MTIHQIKTILYYNKLTQNKDVQKTQVNPICINKILTMLIRLFQIIAIEVNFQKTKVSYAVKKINKKVTQKTPIKDTWKISTINKLRAINLTLKKRKVICMKIFNCKI